jgi:hypothetical protein
MTMRKIDRAFLKRSLGGEFVNGPRASWTLLNEAEGRVYFLGWNTFYQDFSYPLRNGDFYAPVSDEHDSKGLREWHAAVERVRSGELEGCVILQLASADSEDGLQAEKILDGVFFGVTVETDGELWFRADERRPLNAARAPRQETA